MKTIKANKTQISKFLNWASSPFQAKKIYIVEDILAKVDCVQRYVPCQVFVGNGVGGTYTLTIKEGICTLENRVDKVQII